MDEEWPSGDGKDNIVHIWGQDFEHGNAYIIGDKKGLINLKEAIDKAIINGKSAAKTFVNDGEGFKIIVMHVSDDLVKKMAVPYTDEIAGQQVDGIIYPWDIGDKP